MSGLTPIATGGGSLVIQIEPSTAPTGSAACS